MHFAMQWLEGWLDRMGRTLVRDEKISAKKRNFAKSYKKKHKSYNGREIISNPFPHRVSNIHLPLSSTKGRARENEDAER